MKRFTETRKWDDPWFAALPPEHKLIWLYLCDVCDSAGFWPVQVDILKRHTGVTEEAWKNFVEVCGENRVRLISGYVWLVKFILFQFPKGLQPKDPARISVERSLIRVEKEALTRGLRPDLSFIVTTLYESGMSRLRSSYQAPGGGLGIPWVAPGEELSVGWPAHTKEVPRSLVPPIGEGEGEGEGDRRKEGGTGGRKAAVRLSLEEVRLLAAKTGLPPEEADKFFHFYESKGWKVGKTPMKSVASAMAGWKLRWQATVPAARSTPLQSMEQWPKNSMGQPMPPLV